jgi:hypothetical protein
MATRPPLQRYDQALAYVRNIDDELAGRLESTKTKTKQQLGAAISLEGGGFWHLGSPNQHMALRGLLLCQNVFLKPPICFYDAAGNGRETKNHFKNHSEADIVKAIESYTRRRGVTLQQFAQAARNVSHMDGTFNPLIRTRDETGNWGGGSIVCFNGVKVWLFSSGLCSLQWYFNEGANLDANTCNQIVGDGTIVEERDIDNIQEGWIFNIHHPTRKDVCHWGVVLGRGRAAASNTQEAWPGGGRAESILYRVTAFTANSCCGSRWMYADGNTTGRPW